MPRADAPLTYTFDTSRIDAWVQKFPVTGGAIAEKEMRAALNDGLSYISTSIVDFAPVNTGIYRGSIFDEVRIVKFDPIEGAEIEGFVSSSDYAPKATAIEFGRKPGRMPPVEAIALWAKRKQLAKPTTRRGKRTALRIQARTGRSKNVRNVAINQATLSIAWAIAKTIAKRGTRRFQGDPPKGPFERGFDISIDYLAKTFDEAIDRILNYWSRIE